MIKMETLNDYHVTALFRVVFDMVKNIICVIIMVPHITTDMKTNAKMDFSKRINTNQ